MNSIYKSICAFVLAGTSANLLCSAITPGQIRFHNETDDTTKITSMLVEVSSNGYPKANEAIGIIAKKFIGTPYAPGTLESDTEQLTINIDQFDCTTFVETVMAMAMTLNERRTSWRDFAYNLEQLRYRNGELNGYASRLHYVSDWIVDNAHRGLLEDVTDRIGNADHKIKSLDYITTHRDKYPSLKDDAEFERMKNLEIGYRSHRLPYLKAGKIPNAALKTGDVVALLSNTPGLDVSHMGIIEMDKNEPMLIHASSKEGKVVLDRLPLSEYIRRSKDCYGVRVIRLK